MSLLLVLILACGGSTPPTAVDEAPVAAPPGAAPTVPLPRQVPSAEVMTYDFSPTDWQDALVAGQLGSDPMRVLFLRKPPWSDSSVVTGWIAENPTVYAYLPTEVQDRPEVVKAAMAAGLPQGVVVSRAEEARVEPRADAPVARYAAETVNGYISEGRLPQTLEAGERRAVIERRVVAGRTWLQLTEAVPSNPERDQEAWEMNDNVGGVAREDFSLAVDPGWVPSDAVSATAQYTGPTTVPSP